MADRSFESSISCMIVYSCSNSEIVLTSVDHAGIRIEMLIVLSDAPYFLVMKLFY
jgi:hypothetical protein